MKVLTLMLILFLSGCSPKIKDLSRLCRHTSNSYACARIIEEHQLLKYSGQVQRTGDKLILKLDDKPGLMLQVSDKIPGGVWYSFRDYLKDLDSWLIHVQYYEGREYLLVHRRSGEKVLVPGIPESSPGNKRFVTYNSDLESGYTFNGFVVYRISGNAFRKEFEASPNDWGPADAKWKGDNRIVFQTESRKNGHVKPSARIIYKQEDRWEAVKRRK